MIPWYLTDADRLASEYEGLLTLAATASWLTVDGVRLDTEARACIDIEIRAAGRGHRAVVRYPIVFPFTPPSVLPLERESWSGHQYGNGGELCLEWGADNWLPTLTGADMVLSAERLLTGEADGGEALRAIVPSRHDLTPGQETRASLLRVLVTQAWADRMNSLPMAAVRTVEMVWTDHEPGSYLTPVNLVDGDEVWTDPTVPSPLWSGVTLYKGAVFRLPSGVEEPRETTATAMRAFLSTQGFRPDEDAPGWRMLLLWTDGGARLLFFRSDVDLVNAFTVVPAGGGSRLPVSYACLAGKSVGLVGCGSAGSKIATSLARAGVGRFVLVDDDLLLPENLVRNDLDWSVIGEHKVRGVARRIGLASPGVKVDVHLKRLAAQEASGVADSVLRSLQDCDLVIDATAEPTVFNLLSAVVGAARRPMVWLGIFAGGVGGEVARSRPGLDPSPQLARARIDAWCADQGVTAPRPSRPYETGAEAEPLIADDADVTVIAAQGARLALDILTETTPSAFPQSAYLIGLREGWIFTQPFHTHGIDLGPPEASTPKIPGPNGIELVSKLIATRIAEAADPS